MKRLLCFVTILLFSTTMFAFIQNLSNETNVLHISDYRANVIKNRDKLYTISEVAIEEYQILADEGLEYVKSIKRIGISPVRPIIIDDSLYVAGKNNNSENIIKVIDISNDEMQFVRDINLGVGEAIAEIHNYGRYLIYTQYVSIINHVFDLDTNQEVTQYNFGAYNAIKDSLMFTLWISDETEISIENISDIYNPIHISLVSFPQMDFVVKYLFKDNYLFAVGNDKIAILDISDINNPTLVSFIDNIPYTLSDVEIFTGAKIVNNYLIFNDMRNYLWIYDISDLNSPQFVHNYSTMFDGFHYRDNFTIINDYLYITSYNNYLNKVALNNLPEINISDNFGLCGPISNVKNIGTWIIYQIPKGVFAINMNNQNNEPVKLSAGASFVRFVGNDSSIAICNGDTLSIFQYNDEEIILKNQQSIIPDDYSITFFNQYLFMSKYDNGLTKVYEIDENYNVTEIANFSMGNTTNYPLRTSHYTLDYLPVYLKNNNNSKFLCLLSSVPPFTEYARIKINNYIGFLENNNVIFRGNNHYTLSNYIFPNQFENYENNLYGSTRINNDYLFKNDSFDFINDGHAEFYSFLNHNYEELFGYDFNPNIFNAFLSDDHEYLYSIHRFNIYRYDCDYVSNEDSSVNPVSDNALSNYPNPFNPNTTISFNIPKSGNVDLVIYNIKGQKVKILTNEKYLKGEHSLIWNGKNDSNQNVSSGVYFYKLNVDGKTVNVKKCLLMK